MYRFNILIIFLSKLNFRLENIIIINIKRSIKSIGRLIFILILRIFILIVSRNYKKNTLFLVFFRLIILPVYVFQFFKYYKIVEINLYYIFKRLKKNELKTFFINCITIILFKKLV